MSLKFGLNVKGRTGADEAPTRNKRSTIFDDDLDAGSEDDESQQKYSNAFGQEEELTEFGGPIAAPSRSSAPVPKRKNATKPGLKPPVRKPKPLVDLDDDRDDDKPEFGDLSSMRDARAIATKAESVDPTIYDYDAFHSAHSLVHQQKKAAEKQDAVERKPKYIQNLLDAASRRKQDQLVAREKLLQKERENEGDEFADKDKFVTGAYKAQQEETRKLEEEEKRKADEEEQRRRKNGGGMQGFYRNIMGAEDKRHQEAMEAAAKLERGEVPVSDAADEDGKVKTDAELAAEMQKKGVNVHINDEGQVVDKRELLSAGLNIAPAVNKKGAGLSADHLKASNQKGRENAFAAGRYDKNDQKAMRERQTRMLEAQLEESNKRKREEEEEERKKLEESVKSRKTESDVMSAKERYLARKKAQEEAKKKGGA